MKLVDPESALDPAQWRKRSVRWERLSIARGVLVVALGLVLIDALRLS